MSVAQPSTNLCRACGRTFGFPVDYCAFCGVAQLRDGQAAAPARSPPPRIEPEETGPTAMAARAPVRSDKAPEQAGASRPANRSGPDPFRPGPEIGEGPQNDNACVTGQGNAAAAQGPAARRKTGGIPAAPALAGVLVLAGLAAVLFRPAWPGPTAMPAPTAPATTVTIHIAARGYSQTLAFTQGTRVGWTYPPCAAPAPPACVDLVALGQERFTLGGPQAVSGDRVTGRYTFHRDIIGRFRSGADESVDVQMRQDPP